MSRFPIVDMPTGRLTPEHVECLEYFNLDINAGSVEVFVRTYRIAFDGLRVMAMT